MENLDKKACEEGVCKKGGSCCGMQSMNGMHCHGGRHHLIKIILKLIIVGIIFSFGFKLGEISGSIRSERGFGGRGGFGMMRGNFNLNEFPAGNDWAPVSAQDKKQTAPVPVSNQTPTSVKTPAKQ